MSLHGRVTGFQGPESGQDMDDIKGRTVVITGATGALGSHLCSLFAERGAAVHAIGGPEHAFPDGLAVAGTFRTDLGKAEGRASVISYLDEAAPDASVFINCAARGGTVRASELDSDELQSMLSLNTVAPFAIGRAAAERLKKARRTGSVINISSLLATRGLPGSLCYSASKAALDQVTRSMALEYGRHGIRFNSIAAGWFSSAMADGIVSGPAGGILRQRNPMRRFAEPSDFDGVVLLLASDSSAYINGAVIPVDGGQYLV